MVDINFDEVDIMKKKYMEDYSKINKEIGDTISYKINSIMDITEELLTDINDSSSKDTKEMRKIINLVNKIKYDCNSILNKL